ncbi:MAG TPA: 23S rRNA (guanosine(2251)-2'-O)-methyltransferase RlmB [Burkholderiales bacterium]|jgi:23S rRNA (guanosine2251-2'-O)-methyltransferase|nr:23S rRNA (guanosine(2251)-2'-O)-methyltransferase RlmB [Burkholderiales bacterium]
MSGRRAIHGLHAVTAALKRRPEAVFEVFLDPGRNDPRARRVADLARTGGVRLHHADMARLDGLAKGARHQGVVAFVEESAPAGSMEEVLESATEPPLLLVLDGVQDPHNLGACLRVADAMGVHAVIAPKDRAVGLSATVHKVASGAAESVPFIVVTNLARALRDLKDKGIWVLGAAEAGATTLFEARLSGALAVVLGAEGQGLRRLTRETCDELIAIPMLGQVESLNVSVAAGICLYEARRQRHAASSGAVNP